MGEGTEVHIASGTAVPSDVLRTYVTQNPGYAGVISTGNEFSSCSFQVANSSVPTIKNRVELAITVKLVAEQVSEEHNLGSKRRGNCLEPEFVDLKETRRVGTARDSHQSRGNTASHVGSGEVAYHFVFYPERSSYQSSSGCLAVGGTDNAERAVDPVTTVRNEVRFNRNCDPTWDGRPRSSRQPQSEADKTSYDGSKPGSQV